MDNTHTKKILMLLPWMEMGGADLFNLSIVEKINRDAFSVSIVCTYPGKNCWKSRFEKYVSDIHILPDFLKPEEYAQYILNLIGSQGTDLVFLSNSYYGYHLLPLLKCTYPQVAVLDYVHMEEWYWRNGGYARLSGMSEYCIDQTLVCNRQTEKVLVNHFARTPETVKTLYIGVDHKRFHPISVSKGEVRAKYNIPEEKKVVLFPCRIHPQKRPFLMLEIAKRVIQQEKNICFFVAGNGPQYQELTQKINQEKLSSWFICPGEIPEMEKVYADSDLTLICSLKEGLSLTAYESCAMATPVVSADVGGQKELIDATVGRLIPLYQKETDIDSRDFVTEEVDAYVDAILEILRDTHQYAQLSRNCRVRIEEEFSSERMIANLEKILMDTIEKVQKTSQKDRFPNRMMGWARHYLDTYLAYEEALNPHNNSQDLNLELKRIANSRLGRFAIKILLKLRINKLFR